MIHQTSQADDIRAMSLTWENFQLYLQEYQTACRFFEWERASAARDKALANLESNFDIYMNLNKRTWLSHISKQ